MLLAHTAGLEPAIDGLDRSFGDSNPYRAESFDSISIATCKRSFGIHFGIALCTAVKYQTHA